MTPHNRVSQGQIWMVKLPTQSHPQPVLVVQSNPYNRSALTTAVCIVLNLNWRLAEAPGNLLLSPADTGLPKACVANVAHLITVDEEMLCHHVGTLPPFILESVLDGIQLLLGR